MSVDASHRGIQYKLSEIGEDEWRWAFTPPSGPPRSGIVEGEYGFALTVVRRAIEVWHLMNRSHQSEAA